MLFFSLHQSVWKFKARKFAGLALVTSSRLEFVQSFERSMPNVVFSLND